jgi:hypothetical protein
VQESFNGRLKYKLDESVRLEPARKQLRGFLASDQRLRLLRWAADSDIGHRGFLELGGARLIWSAVGPSGSPPIMPA